MQVRQLASPENANHFVNLDYLGLVQSGLIDVNDFKPIDPEVQKAARRKYRIFKGILIMILLTILSIFIGVPLYFMKDEIFELMRELPSISFDIKDAHQANTSYTDDNSEMLSMGSSTLAGAQVLIPQQSLAQMLENQLTSNANQNFSNLETFQSFSNLGSFSFAPGTTVTVVPATSNLPTSEPFSGAYGFKINVQSTQNPKKTVSWTYSKMLNKLYCHPNVPCPVEFNVSQLPPLGAIIRATAIYAKFEHVQTVITRCENHKKSKEFDQDSKPNEISHLIRCQHPQAVYETDSGTKRESVVIPFEIPQTGTEWTTALYKFMCYSSCVGGSQKPVKIVFTLEYNGEVLGRNSYEIKICACPGRDRSTDEKRLKKPSMKGAELQRASSLKQVLDETIKVDQRIEPSKKKLKESAPNAITGRENSLDDNQVFTLVIKGRKNYEMLKQLNEALEIQTIVARLKRTASTSINKQPSIPIPAAPLAIGHNEPAAQSKPAVQVMGPPSQPVKKQTLEQFLDAIDMIAYCNILKTKGVWTLDDLLKCDKKKINSLKISQTDTDKLWASIQALKTAEGYQDSSNAPASGSVRKITVTDSQTQKGSIQPIASRATRSNTVKRKLEDMQQPSLNGLGDNLSFNFNDLSTSFLNSSMFKNDNLVEISKSDLKLSILNE